MRHYAISGRIHGDDERTTMLVIATSTAEAREKFTDAMRGLYDSDPGTPVYIDSIVTSETEITFAHDL